MNPGIRRIGTQNMYYQESRQDSNITLVFVPGGFNPEIWRHQIRYFSKKYSTIAFEPVDSMNNFEGEVEALENVLSQPEIENAVLVSSILGNPVANRFENKKNVLATIRTGSFCQKVPGTFYRHAWRIGLRKPKILKKFFFSKDTDYKIVKQFAEDVKPPEHSSFTSYTGKERKHPDKPSITIHGSEDRFSSIEDLREIYTENSIRKIERAGSFSFYEKPQEYNKVLNDFLVKLEEFMQKKELVAAKSRNRSLREFEAEKKPVMEK